VVEITIGGGGELESSEADIVKSFVINAEGLIRVLHKLVNGEGGVVRLQGIASQLPFSVATGDLPTHLNDSVRDLG
jgi:hypothetical protein